MSIQINSELPSEETLFEPLLNVSSKVEFLIKLKTVFEQIFRLKLSSLNLSYPRLILKAIEEYKPTYNQIRILFFLMNYEKAAARNIAFELDDAVYSFILKHSGKLLDKIITTGLFPYRLFEINENIPEKINLPDLSIRKQYIRTFLVKSFEYDNEKKQGKIFCRLENGETATIFLLAPWDSLIKRNELTYGQIIAFYNIRTLDKEGIFIADRNTLLILSPDMLLDVTDIKSCINNINDYLITRLCYTKKPSRAQIIGNAVNYIFDEMLSGEYDLSDVSILKSLQTFKLNLTIVNLTAKDILSDVSYHLNSIVNSGILEKIKQNGKYSIEPSFISPEFGITGRIDVLYDSTEEIMELKTGKPKNYDAWDTDKTQTALYSLMLLENPASGSGEISVFYSKDEKNPFRKIKAPYPALYLNSIIRRNDMILIDRRLANFKPDEMKYIVSELISGGKSSLYESYRETLIQMFKKAEPGSIKEIAQNYAAEFISFCERERVFEKLEFSSLWQKSEYQKREEYKITGPLKFDKYIRENNILNFSVDYNDSRFREGDICIIYDGLKDISRQKIIRGTIKSISRNKVMVSIRNKSIGDAFISLFKSDESKWMLESDYMDISSRKEIWALTEFLKSDESRQKILLGLKEPEFDEINNHDFDNKISSVKKQKEAIERALAAKNYFLVQGPPGTGKTTLLAHLIKEILKDPNERILVTAFTNRAVDEVLNKILSETDLKDKITRLGSEFSTEHDWLSIQRQLENIPEEGTQEFLKTRRAYFSTIATASFNDIFHLLDFSTAIIDEASQITEPETLSIILKAKRFILIGDEKQLPAVIAQSNSDNNIKSIETNNCLLRSIGLNRLDSSLFERLVKINKEKDWAGCIMLDRQYRMNDKIIGFSNLNFYNSLLYSNDEIANSKIEILSDEKILSDTPVEFFDIKGHGEKKKNKTEAELLVRLLEKYRSAIRKTGNDLSFGVIAPFRAQVSLISQELERIGIEDVKVDTVERFQGGERDIIFISFTVYHHSQVSQIQSIIEEKNIIIDRKLNVTLTRARKKVIMIGNGELLEKNTIFRNLIEYCKTNGKYTKVSS